MNSARLSSVAVSPEGAQRIPGHLLDSGVIGADADVVDYEDYHQRKYHAEALRRLIPVGRMGGSADVAAAVAFLASERSAFTTGEILDVNGGMWCD